MGAKADFLPNVHSFNDTMHLTSYTVNRKMIHEAGRNDYSSSVNTKKVSWVDVNASTCRINSLEYLTLMM